MRDNSTCGSDDPGDIFGTKKPRDIYFQIAISVALGVGTFIAFCILRPRWKGLYAARKKYNQAALSLPELPDSFFGWILPVWRITDEQVLASAGLDAYVFLAFFKMANKFLAVTLFFALVVIKPVHDYFPEKKPPLPDKGSEASSFQIIGPEYTLEGNIMPTSTVRSWWLDGYETDYLWMYLIFAYLFSGFAAYLIITETRKVIQIRQQYLGSQTTITDRTIRLSGIPPELRSEDKIKEFVEDLEIGKVESVTLCKDWKEIDDLMIERMKVLRRLEEAWTIRLGHRRVERSLETLPIVQPVPPGPMITDEECHPDESSGLLQTDHMDHVPQYPYPRSRPTIKIWQSRLRFSYKTVDAIDYYEEKLRNIDIRIKALRKKEFEPTPLAFVTMDSVASAQMAIQAVLDPSPLLLMANTSPAPSDVVWQNTYLPRSKRMARAWAITGLIGLLTIFWTLLLVPIATALKTCSINEVWPGLARLLNSHELVRSLINTQVPTLLASLLNIAVPYLYSWLSNLQGMISQGDVELSVISKNFFFTFFNFFVIFTLLGTASGLLDLYQHIGEKLKDTETLAQALATSLQNLLMFYVNFIILQGLGLFPLRLIEFGSVALYPINLIGAKTPRDYAELVQPPVFSYGFYLPQTLLIFIICMVYSVLRHSWMVLLSGLFYFFIGHFVHKYQLLYAMDHRQHSTGRGWGMICDRVIVGMVLFQLIVACQLVLNGAFRLAASITPLLFLTIWFSYAYSRSYKPLLKYIALRSLRRAEHSNFVRTFQPEGMTDNPWAEDALLPRIRQTVDEARESGLRFVNPSLTAPLHDVWIADKSARVIGGYVNGTTANSELAADEAHQ